jgi:hypothetical protein
MAKTTTFGVGDTVKIEGTVVKVFSSTNELRVQAQGGGESLYVNDASAKLVKRAIPAVPKAGTLVKVTDQYWGGHSIYLVRPTTDDEGNLDYIDSLGNLYKSYGTWKNLDHTGNEITVLN